MDKTLMRPLFKQKAEQLRKVDSTKVPKYAIGGLLAAGRAMAAPVYRYLAPRVAPYLQKAQQAMATPKGQGILAGLEGTAVYQGAGDVAAGVKEGDYYRTLGGLSTVLPGMAYLPSSLRGTGIKSLQGIQDFERLAPLKTGKGVAGALGTAALGYGMAEPLPGEAATTEKTKADRPSVEERLIYSKPEYANDIVDETALEQSTMTKGPRAIGVKEPKGAYEVQLNKDLPLANKIINTAEKLGIDVSKLQQADDKQLKQIAIESNVDIKDVYRLSGKEQKQVTPKNYGPSGNNVIGYTADEVEMAAKVRNEDKKAAKALTSTSPLASEFQQFKNKIAEVTGTTNDSLNDLVLMKAAGGYLTGKTRQKGVSGFFDITGQVLQSSADDLMKIKLNQQNYDLQLAQAFLKAKGKGTGPKILAQSDTVVRVRDDSVPGGFRNEPVLVNEEGTFLQRQLDANGNQILVQPKFTGEVQKPNIEKKNEAFENLYTTGRAQGFVDFVAKNTDLAGAKGVVTLSAENIFGTMDSLGNLFQGITEKGYGSSIDQQIEKQLSTLKKEKTGVFSKSLGADEAIEQYRKELKDATDKDNLTKQWIKNTKEEYKRKGIAFNDLRPTAQDLDKYAKLALIERRMKYLIANQNKQKDRLTQKDLEDAGTSTMILDFWTSPDRVAANYRAIADEMKDKAQVYLLQFKNNGGTEQIIQDQFYDQIPGIKEMYDQSAKAKRVQTIQNNKQARNNILGTIPIAGGK